MFRTLKQTQQPPARGFSHEKPEIAVCKKGKAGDSSPANAPIVSDPCQTPSEN
jgi:hypothetical protein